MLVDSIDWSLLLLVEAGFVVVVDYSVVHVLSILFLKNDYCNQCISLGTFEKMAFVWIY